VVKIMNRENIGGEGQMGNKNSVADSAVGGTHIFQEKIQ
jgi:hypothetical protein